MVETSTIPLLNAQQLSMANLVHGALIMPELAQASTHELALRLLHQEARQVNKPDGGSQSELVAGEDSGGRSGGGGTPFRRRDAEEKDTDESPSPSDNPLVGKLLNVKV